jgi:tetratricopeptide (TPR) repeat protein
MDCDDVTLLLARETALSDGQAMALDDHVATCEVCAGLVLERVRGDLALPAIDPAYFDIGEPIAAGGMGKITRAFDRRLGREVAIKEVLSPKLRARFEREAAITARLQHPAIVPIYEAGTWPDGRAFYTMRLVSGGTLGDAIAERPTLERRLELLPHLIAVTEALAYAHSRGVIHRDLKPQNILIGEFGETVVIDWGLAKERGGRADSHSDASAGEAPALTQAGTVVGTPCFMSPEQARGEELDERADVFALGALVYNLLTGSAPYWDRTHNGIELIAAVHEGPPTPILTLAPRAPADLCAIIDHAMARDVAARYQDASQVAAELRRFQAGQLLLSREYRMRDLLARWVRRHRTIVTSVGIGAVLLGIVATVAVIKITSAREAEQAQRTIAEQAFEIGEQRGQRKLCAASAPALASPWDATARDLVHRQFASTKLPYVVQTLERVDTNLDRWSDALAKARDAICDGATERPGEQLAAELDCLADRTREGRALISQFHDADDAVVLNAVGATEALPPMTRCTTAPPRVLPASSPATDAVRASFAKTHALMNLGKYRDALPIAREALTGADASGDLRTRAAARVVLGAALLGTSDLDGATTTLDAAIRLAETAQDDRSRAQAWVNRIRIEYVRGKFELVAQMQTAALGATERIGDAWLSSEVMLSVGGSLGQLGKHAEAQALFETAVQLRRKLYGDRDRRTAFALSALGNAYAMQGQLEAGTTAHREAVEIASAGLGSTHPSVAMMRGNLASDYIYGLHFEQAIAELEAALVTVEAAYGPKHRDVAMTLTNLGNARYEADQHAAALETFTRAEAIWQDINAKHPILANVLVNRYRAKRALGRRADVADLERALELGKGLPPFQRAHAELALGMASRGPRAIELVEASAKGFGACTLPLCQRELAVAKAWLTARSRGQASR